MAKQKKDAGLIKSAIKKLYNKTAPLLLLEGVLFIFAAILIFFRPIEIFTTLTFVLGGVLILFGLYQTFIGFFGGRDEKDAKTFNIIFGIINVIIGLVFFMQPLGSLIAVMYVFAALFLFKSIKSLILSIQMWRAKIGGYVAATVLSIIMILISILILMFPGAGAITAMYYLGGILLFYAVSDIYMYFELLKLKRSAS